MAKKNNVYLDKDIEILELDNSVNDILRSNNINIISDLWQMNRKKLKDMDIKDSDIKQITIKLQLLGLDLNKRVYN